MDITLTIPMVPSKNILGQSRWHRNSHNDRLVWQRKVAEAVDAAGLAGAWMLWHVEIDWGRRRPTIREKERDAVWDECVAALTLAGLAMTTDGLWTVDDRVWTGVGAGVTRIKLANDE